MQTASHHTLSCIAVTTKIRFQTSKQIEATGGQVITVCRVILLYKARVVNSLLSNQLITDLWTKLQCWKLVCVCSECTFLLIYRMYIFLDEHIDSQDLLNAPRTKKMFVGCIMQLNKRINLVKKMFSTFNRKYFSLWPALTQLAD